MLYFAALNLAVLYVRPVAFHFKAFTESDDTQKAGTFGVCGALHRSFHYVYHGRIRSFRSNLWCPAFKNYGAGRWRLRKLWCLQHAMRAILDCHVVSVVRNLCSVALRAIVCTRTEAALTYCICTQGVFIRISRVTVFNRILSLSV